MISQKKRNQKLALRASITSSLPLYLGFLIFFFPMVVIGSLQFLSVKNITEMDKIFTRVKYNLLLSDRTREISLGPISREMTSEPYWETVELLYRTYSRTYTYEALESIINGNDTPEWDILLKAIDEIEALIDLYEKGSYRSLVILFISFLFLTLILMVIVSLSEIEQHRRYLNEKEKKEMDQKLVELLEREKNIIALELHDDLAQKLSHIQNRLAIKGSSDKEGLGELIRQSIHNVRSLSQNLRSPSMDSGSLQDYISDLYSDFTSRDSCEFHSEFHGLGTLELKKEARLHVYRMIQELLSNSWKHSRAGMVIIRVIHVYPLLRIIYEDDGVGFNKGKKTEGMGLEGIRYRLGIMEGQMKLVTAEGAGVRIILEVPTDL